MRAYNVRDWKGERSENTLAWSEAEAVALESPTAVVERVETIAGTPKILQLYRRKWRFCDEKIFDCGFDWRFDYGTGECENFGGVFFGDWKH